MKASRLSGAGAWRVVVQCYLPKVRPVCASHIPSKAATLAAAGASEADRRFSVPQTYLRFLPAPPDRLGGCILARNVSDAAAPVCSDTGTGGKPHVARHRRSRQRRGVWHRAGGWAWLPFRRHCHAQSVAPAARQAAGAIPAGGAAGRSSACRAGGRLAVGARRADAEPARIPLCAPGATDDVRNVSHVLTEGGRRPPRERHRRH
eukprot:ctg_1093.g453